jgi:L-histidine N-alpha-methyltransferase
MSASDAEDVLSAGPAATMPPDPATRHAVAAAVADGLLRPDKRLPAWLLYDPRGSALFEEITALPEYYPTRTERAILAAHAGEMIALASLDQAGAPLAVAELGAGTASKTQLLLAALLERQRRAFYVPIDVSPAALAIAEAALSRYRGLSVHPMVGRYPEDLGVLDAIPGRRLLIFLGSNLGNYEPDAARELLRAVRARLRPGDTFLVGADLRKPASVLLPAYDDAAGMTARFNKNVLVRLNRELGAEFDPDSFRHVVRWNPARSRIELYLQSEREQRVAIRALGAAARFTAGECIHTESSHKFTRAGLRTLFTGAGFRRERTWLDGRRWFAVTLLRVPPG